MAAAAAVAAYVLDLLADVAVDHEGHVVVVMLVLVLVLLLLPAVQSHHPGQAEALVLRLLHPRGRAAAPDAVQDCRIHHRHDEDEDDGGDDDGGGEDERASEQDRARARARARGLRAPYRHSVELCSAGVCLKSQTLQWCDECHTHTH